MRVIMAGCGNMGYAMLNAWLDAGKVRAGESHVVEPGDKSRNRATARGFRGWSDAADLPDDVSADLVVLAVKPQIMADVAPHYQRFAASGATFMSIAAGVTLPTLGDYLGSTAPIIRCMPNTPAAIGRGMMVTISNGHVSPDMTARVEDLLTVNGEVDSVSSETEMDVVTAISGSGPAYVFHLVECLTDAGIGEGLPPETAALLARQTVAGAAQLVIDSDEPPSTLREQVTSPHGTTAAALDVLMGGDRMKQLIAEAVDAARRRSVELGKT